VRTERVSLAPRMPTRRDEIRMSDEELERFLGEQRTLACATVGPKGRPHLIPLWYVPGEGELRCWTFAKSQKARNLERDPRATVQVDAGEEYGELRGAMLECDVELERDVERVATIGLELMRRYATDGPAEDELEAGVRAQAPKRVGMRFRPTRIVTWDHRKLGGTY
jgi:PPOX class probable F420-dependent enzyme